MNITQILMILASVVLNLALNTTSYGSDVQMQYKHPSGEVLNLIKEDEKYFIRYQSSENPVDIEIPEEITKARNCKKFLDWQEINVPPLFPKFPCPWEKYNPNIRKIEINGLHLHIPRTYLSCSSKIKPDGKETQIMLDFLYPQKQPGIGNGKEAISVWVEDPYGHSIPKYHKDMDSYLLYEYWYMLFAHKVLDISEDKPVELSCYVTSTCKIDIIDKGYNEYTKRNLYLIRNTIEIVSEEKIKKIIDEETNLERKEDINRWYERDKKTPIYHHEIEVYTNDNPRKPVDFVVCAVGQGGECDGVFLYKNVYFKLGFSKRKLVYYAGMQEYLLSLIKQWEYIK